MTAKLILSTVVVGALAVAQPADESKPATTNVLNAQYPRVYPDGRAHNLTEGIARAKYRNSYSAPELMRPGQVYKVDVELFPTSNWFEAGHRIRIEVASSDFPNFARNLNTANSDSGTEIKVAHTKILHSRQYPSSIVLPVVGAGQTVTLVP